MSLWSLSWKTLKNRRYFYSGWGWCLAWMWDRQPGHCSLHSSYHLGQQSSSSRWGAWGACQSHWSYWPWQSQWWWWWWRWWATPPPGPPIPHLGGTGAAISNTQCNNKLNPTLLISNWSIESTLYCLCKHLSHLYAFIGL